MKLKGCYWKIRGKVQGVWYRASAKQEADRLGLRGHVNNEPDGSVCISVYGNAEDIKKFKVWCWNGPLNAMVESIEEEELPFIVLSDFAIHK
ncbi:MAG: acylphosphatase [Saprospiraceae bacterium]|nr:acylphosphatase [Saprospiraceae bacterium]